MRTEIKECVKPQLDKAQDPLLQTETRYITCRALCNTFGFVHITTMVHGHVHRSQQSVKHSLCFSKVAFHNVELHFALNTRYIMATSDETETFVS